MLIQYVKIRRFLHQFRQKTILQKRIIIAVVLVFVLNLGFGVLFYLAERGMQPDLTLADSIWWAFVTMTTVGYGDISAVTVWGRFIISYPCMVLGIGIIGYFIRFLAENILQSITKTRRGLMQILDEGHLILCNYPGDNKIVEIVGELRAAPKYKKCPVVLVTEKLEELPESLRKLHVKFVNGFPTDEEVLFQANILKCGGVIILGNRENPTISDERSFTVGTIIELIEREHGVAIKTVAEVVNRKNLKLIQRSNVNGTTSNDGITSRMLVQEFLHPGIHDIIHQLLSNFSGSQLYIFPTRLVGRKVVDIQLEIIKHPETIQVIGIIKNGEKILNPSKAVEIESGDQLILLAESLEDFSVIENSLLAGNK
ncbi:MAG: hypothetical protein GY866_08165 [Proteobacteria bacterium]|nr:hypothetical protein [Pseudomonadota bacterium]